MMSEFNKYIEYSYIKLRGGHFCLERQRYIKDRSMNDIIDRLDVDLETISQLAADSIDVGDIDKLKRANQIEVSIEALIARSDREWSCPECKIVHHRDGNAAINIKNEALKQLNNSPVLPGSDLKAPSVTEAVGSNVDGEPTH